MKTNKIGISLVALVVTIIVLAILAGAAIVSLLDNDVVNSSKDVVAEQELYQVRDVASTAWIKALADLDEATPEEYINYIINFLKRKGYTDETLDKYTIVADVNGVTVNLKGSGGDDSDVTPDEPGVDPDMPEVDPDEPDVNPDVPGDTEYAGLTITKDTEGVTFTKADGVTPGDPDNLEAGDIVTYGDYEYRYNMHPNTSGVKLKSWVVDNELNGWHVLRRNKNLASASELCGTIYGKPLVSMQDAFYYCQKLVSAPVIPSSVTNMNSTFYDCTSLTEAPVIPSSVTNMSSTFSGCTSLTEAPVIPSSVTSMYRTFDGCTSLTEAPVIPSSVTNMNGTFYDCESLTEAPVIPSSVTNMYSTFSGCTSLTEAPVIPSSVMHMNRTFSGCTSLTGQVQINSSRVSDITDCFYDISNPLTIKVPVSSTTYDKITADYGSSSNITIETFEPET